MRVLDLRNAVELDRAALDIPLRLPALSSAFAPCNLGSDLADVLSMSCPGWRSKLAALNCSLDRRNQVLVNARLENVTISFNCKRGLEIVVVLVHSKEYHSRIASRTA